MYAEAIVVYSDVLFLLNFALDFLCLFITARLLNRKTTTSRLCIASVLGALYAFVPYLAEMKVYLSLPMHLLSALSLCLIAFKGRERIAISLITFISASALLGGLITAIYSLVGEYSLGIYRDVSLGSFIVILAVSLLIAICYLLIFRKSISVKSVGLRILVCDQVIQARMLCDSGNLVTEPFSALPVVILSSTCLPPPLDAPTADSFPLNLRAVPCATVGGRRCYLAFRPQMIEIITLGSKPKCVDAYIAIDTESKSFSGYDGILPTSLL